MTRRERETRVEELERVADGIDNNKHVEQEARELLSLLTDHDSSELRCRTLLAFSISLARSYSYHEALLQTAEALQLAEALPSKVLIARIINTRGNVHLRLGDYGEALEHYHRALALHEKLDDRLSIARTKMNMGMAHINFGDYPKALEYLNGALAIIEEHGDRSGISRVIGNIAMAQSNLADYPKALESFRYELATYEELDEKSGVARATGNVGYVYMNLCDYPQALEYFNRALALHEALGEQSGIARVTSNIGLVYWHLGDFEKSLEYQGRALDVYQRLGEKAGIVRVTGSIADVYVSSSNYHKGLEYYSSALVMHEEIGEKLSVARMMGNVGEAYRNIQDYPKALEYYNRSIALTHGLGMKAEEASVICRVGKVLASVDYEGRDVVQAEQYLLQAVGMNETLGTKLDLADCHQALSMLYEEEERWQSFALHYKTYHALEKEVQSEEAAKQAMLMEHRRKVDDAERDRQVKLARFQEQEKIFYNILPVTIADRLIEGEKTIAETFDNVSIFFSDIVGFTTMSSHIGATDLVHGLNAVFTEFDRLATKHGVEKIKTIGDAYMAVCGVPEPIEDHTARMARFAFDVQAAIQSFTLGTKQIPLSIRIGVHCGPVVAGVIGNKKFAYDLWGDAVNIASRMESHGEAGKIHCSEDFMRNLHSRDNSIMFEDRGEIDIKGMGTMRTYFLLNQP